MRTLHTATVRVTGGRDGRAVSEDGLLDIALALPAALGGPGRATNPEQLFAAGFAACFNSSLRFAAKSMGLDAGDVAVTGSAALSRADDGAFGVGLDLAVSLPGLAPDEQAAVVAAAKRIGAYTNATRGNVAAEVTLV